MADLGNIDDRIMSQAIGRIQACVDQLVGLHTIAVQNLDGGLQSDPSEHSLKVLALLQPELDKALGLTNDPYNQRLTAGVDWLMEQLKA